MAQIQTLEAKAVIFAGGVGTRMWPASRTNFPKQFEKIINNKSTIQLTVDHLRPEFDWKDIYISTNTNYVNIIRKQLSKIPKENIIGEPVRRDVAPAVGYLMAILEKLGDKPTLILWSDHVRKNLREFKKMIKVGQEFINQNPNKFLFVGEKPRFATSNLGWIEIGTKRETIDGMEIFDFKTLKYQPDELLAQKFFSSKKYFWNPGYWAVKPSFVMQQYQKFQPQMYDKLKQLVDSFGKPEHKKILGKIYPTLDKISFDNAILEKLEPEKGVVLVANMGWSDVGTWQALKEVLQKKQTDNITHGETFAYNSENNLIYNYSSKMVTCIGLKSKVVVVTNDVILVCDQNSMGEIKKVVEVFEKDNRYKKYT